MGLGQITSVHDAETAWESLRDGAARAFKLRAAWWTLSTRWAKARPYLTLLQSVAELDGDIIECGVFRGRSLIRMAMVAKQVCPEKVLYGLDSFDGFPAEAITEGDLGPGRSMEKVRGRFKGAASVPSRLLRTAEELGLNVRLVPGYFDQTLPKLKTRRFCFVHLDCDIYESYKTCLETLYDQVVPGGIILFDEYACPVWPGATRAVDDFFSTKCEKPILCRDDGRRRKPKYYVVKTPVKGAAVAA
jgi:hypothetical protein